ncbi:hypothetical protein BD770DRAFT_304687, partial [Pilaira anomala]
LLKTWYFANVDTVLSLKVFFIHARVHDISDLKDSIKKTCEVVDQMKKEHEEYLLQRQLNPDVEERINLATFVQQEIQKPIRGSKYGLLL